MVPIRKGITLHYAGKAKKGQTLLLIGHTSKLLIKWSVVNTAPTVFNIIVWVQVKQRIHFPLTPTCFPLSA
jgi:hypothetical protein